MTPEVTPLIRAQDTGPPPFELLWSSKPGGPQGRGPAGPESTVKGGWVESETRASFVPTYTLGWQKPSQGGGRPCPESAGGVGEEGGHPHKDCMDLVWVVFAVGIQHSNYKIFYIFPEYTL